MGAPGEQGGHSAAPPGLLWQSDASLHRTPGSHLCSCNHRNVRRCICKHTHTHRVGFWAAAEHFLSNPAFRMLLFDTLLSLTFVSPCSPARQEDFTDGFIQQQRGEHRSSCGLAGAQSYNTDSADRGRAEAQNQSKRPNPVVATR